jgi:Flp pilus assembly protein TadG
LPWARSSRRSDSDQRRDIRSERGSAVIETALAIPLVLLVGVGVLELGRAYQTSQMLTNAAREGARVAAALPNPAAGAVDAKVREYLQTDGLLSDATVGVNVNGSEVTVSYPFQFVVLQPVAQLLVSGSMVDAPIRVTARSVMRNEAGS